MCSRSKQGGACANQADRFDCSSPQWGRNGRSRRARSLPAAKLVSPEARDPARVDLPIPGLDPDSLGNARTAHPELLVKIIGELAGHSTQCDNICVGGELGLHGRRLAKRS